MEATGTGSKECLLCSHKTPSVCGSLQFVGAQENGLDRASTQPYCYISVSSYPQVGQVSGWVKERSFALGSVSYVFGVWVLL